MSDLAEQIFPQRIRDRVVHCKRDDYDVLVDRRTQWGNPYRLDDYDSRATCLAAYLEWLLEGEAVSLDGVGELEGQVLGCHCAPRLCHGHVLTAMAAAEEPREAVGWIRERLDEIKRLEE